MSQLDPQAKDLIGLAREGEGPSEAERSRLRGAVLARVGAGVAILSAASGTASATTTAAGGSVALSFAKVVVAIALVGAVGAGGYVTVSGHRTKAATITVPVSPPATAPVTIAAPGPVVSPSPPLPGRAGSPRESSADTEEAHSEHTAPAPAAASSQILPATGADSTPLAPTKTATRPTTTDQAAVVPNRSLDEETRALRSAIADLRDGHAEGALAAIDAQESRFPGGALAEERAEARIVTLCALGRNDEAHADASRFLRAHPNSLLAGRVLASCGGSGTAGPAPEP
jgi:hypothetical protein